MPSLWPALSSVGIHKDTEASAGCVAVHGYPGCDLHRRHVITTPTEQGAAEKIFAQVVDLLEKLCFLVKKEKWSPIPCQRLIFLGAALDSTTMTLSLPQPKRTSIVDTWHRLLGHGSGSVRTLSTLIGQMSHASQTGILVAPLHYRGLQRLYLQAVSHHGQARKVIVPLTSQAHKDLEWWVSESSCRLNGCPIQLPPINLTVWSNASKTGWGAAYQGISTGGHWSVDEAQWHINVLELRAATLSLKALLQSQEAQHPPLKHIHLRIHKTTAVAYINKRGGTRSPALIAQALELWAVALTAGVSLTAQHIPGIQNVVADTASRQIETRTEWTLDRKIFQSICQRFYRPEVDLFASRLNYQLPKYVSRYPGVWLWMHSSLDWSKWTCLIHPPVVLMPRVLRKIKEDQATAVLLAPNWTGQPWFPDLIQMLVDRPLLLPQRQSLLFLPFQPTAYHPLWKSLHLTV